MKVLAKFKCETIEISGEPESLGFDVRLTPVTSGSEENEQFYRYTPGGEFKLYTLNETAGKYFTPGKEYRITIEEAPTASEDDSQ